jgi:hypothetical protein
LKLFVEQGHEPVLTIEKLVVNGKLSDDEFRFPDRERLARKIKVHEMVGNGFEPAAVEVKKITTAMMARLGATHPGLRESLKEPAFKQIDWKAVEHRDHKLSAILRDLVPIDRHPITDKKPAPSPLAGMGGSTRR